ncbi:MAG: SGNH/GDSL hydrolase family protein [Ruminococcaceae bacterium]|nr:SGNH/GDSL hydrolase family protein [Oscillospiraceae bacterium]
MIKVTLLGDSIRYGAGEDIQGYGARTEELLGDEFEVFQPNDNCKFAKYTLRMLFDYEPLMRGSRIVHWNTGHWDLCDIFGDGTFSTEAEYIDNITRIAKILLSRYDKVIFATTTPVLDTNIFNKNSTIKRFNEIVVPRLEQMGVIINDLHSLVDADRDMYLSADTIHLSGDGVELCANAVAEKIREVAKSL